MGFFRKRFVNLLTAVFTLFSNLIDIIPPTNTTNTTTITPTWSPTTPVPTQSPTPVPLTNPPLPNVITCPATVGERYEFTLNLADDISLEIPTGTFVLCTLILQDAEGFLTPVAHSYNGNGWERAGGFFAAEELSDWSCVSGATFCTSTLPPGHKYIVERRAVDSMEATHPVNARARFLEAATFGPTQALLDNTTWTFGSFVKEQINDVEPTYHRVYFRRRANPMWRFHKLDFAAKLDPCSNDSYWGRSVITVKDVEKDLLLNQTSEGNWQVYIDNHLRSVLNQLRYESETEGVSPTESVTAGLYQVCGDSAQMHRGIFEIAPNGTQDCKQLVKEDLQIDFAGTSNPENSTYIINNSTPPLNDTTAWQRFTGTASKVYRQTGFILQNDENCTYQYDYQDGAPFFVQTQDGIWLQFLPRLDMRENSLENPIADGGVGYWLDDKTAFCSNAPRTFVNEDTCFLSSSSSACVDSTNAEEDAVASDYTGNTTTNNKVLICGSFNEVGNDPTLGDNRLDVSSVPGFLAVDLGIPADTTRDFDLSKQRKYVWSEVSVNAPDQLRQRMAWAIIQIFSIRKIDVRDFERNTESWLVYYDIFVRHAFGSYLDIMKEVSYSPTMGDNLSHESSRSSASLYNPARDVVIYPDENFARELMQLFSLGLVRLNPDGTPQFDPDTGRKILTYDSVDVRSMSRCWTGFFLQKKRANIESPGPIRNMVDPLQVVAEFRDRFPKKDLFGGYIGDGYPLCADFPANAFLKKGAKYRLLGGSATPRNILEDKRWAKKENVTLTRLELASGQSGLYEALCSADTDMNCTYPGVVILDNDLTCPSPTTNAIECKSDTVHLIGVNGIYYEHIRQPCVEFSFYPNPAAVSMQTSATLPTCANPNLPVGGVACCDTVAGTVADPVCEFVAERVTLQTAKDRCAALGKAVCSYDQLTQSDTCPHAQFSFNWRSDSCTIKAKIDRNGEVAIYHETALGIPETFVKNNTVTFFYVDWASQQYPLIDENCSGGSCVLSDEGDECFCEIEVEESPVFETLPASNTAILESDLKVGSLPPGAFDSGTYVSTTVGTYTFHSFDGSCCDINTIFEVDDLNGKTNIFERHGHGKKKYFRNIQSSVKIAGTNFSFRNPPQFNSILRTEYSISDAEYETDAVLQHLFYHPNHAPFLASRFLQRFGVSNASPLFVRRVADAYAKGQYTYGDENISFGSGEYGDLSAMIAAILFDREHLSMALDFDRFHGSVREPIIKVLAVLRALSFEKATPLIELDNMEAKVGEEAYEQPDVFSFFDPIYTPPGIASKGRVVAPETQVMWMNRVIAIMNGFLSLIRRGLVNCGGFGFGSYCDSPQKNGGNLTYVPDSFANRASYMANLSLLLTAGRLDGRKQNTIIAAVNDKLDDAEAFLLGLHLLLTTPEFHSTSTVDSSAKPPPELPPLGPPKAEYKAVIHLTLNGGADSFNMLVPRNTPNCGAFRNEYDTVRGEIGTRDSIFSSQILPLEGDATSMGQPCSDFGVHDALPIFQELYNSGELAFIANVGVLTEPVNITNWRSKTVSQLFAHNSMQAEVGELDPFNQNIGTGVLGRMADALEDEGYNTGRTSISTKPNALGGSSFFGSPIVALDDNGVDLFVRPDITFPNETVAALNGEGESVEQSGLYGGVWSSILLNSIEQTDKLYEILQKPEYAPQTDFAVKRAELLSQLIHARLERGVDRDLFLTELGGYDMHSRVLEKLEGNFKTLNFFIQDLVAELKLIGAWDDVVIVLSSDFGRTLTANSGSGSDHGWGGNYFIAGGNIKGKRIMGKYPDKLSPGGNNIIGRGRVIPSTSWDAVFHGIADWMGVEPSKLDEVLPNRNNFDNLFTKEDFFKA